MAVPMNISELLRRGGMLTDAEVRQLTDEFTEAQISEFSMSLTDRSFDQPVKVVPFSESPPRIARGYFTKQKYVFGKTPQEMERVLGVFGKFMNGALVLEFVAPLLRGDFENRAYTYLPGGKLYKYDPEEKVFLPGQGAPQWILTREVQVRCIATLKPGQVYLKSSI